MCLLCPKQESNLQSLGDHGYRRGARAEPLCQLAYQGASSPGRTSAAASLGVGQESLPLDHGTMFGAEAARLELATVLPAPVFKTGSSSGRMTSVCKLRGLESNQHQDVQSVPSYR